MAMETLTMLYNSEKKKVVMKHTPEKRIIGRRINKKHSLLDCSQRKFLVEDAVAALVWNIVHKKFKFQLSHPNLQDWDCCLPGAEGPQVSALVGDQHQHIYSFRGAVNALDLVLKSNLTKVRANHITQTEL